MKRIATLLFILCGCVASLTAQQTTTPSASALATTDRVAEALLTPRSALGCFPSREQMDAAEGSEFAIPLTSWQREELPHATRFTTRFKRNYRFDDKQIVLRVEGATGAISIEVNGTEVGYTSSGACRSEFDLTKRLKENNNLISIVVHKHFAAQALESAQEVEPNIARTTLLTPPRVAVADAVVSTKFNKQGDGLLSLGVVMQSFLLNSKDYTIYYELYSPEGTLVSSANKELTTRMLSRDTVNFHARIPAVRKWTTESPELYRLVVYTRHENRIKEFTTTQIGFRTVEVDEGEFRFNGEPLALKPALHTYSSMEQSREELQRLKQEGHNLIFTLHAVPDEFYSFCDKLGMMVCTSAYITCPESDFASSPSNNPAWKEHYQWRANTAYHQTKIHPSVVMFSIGYDAQNGICLYESYLKMKELKGESRPFVYPHADGEWNSDL
ncbi:MAG: hypothetical protein J6R93_01770 [Tidjanibacter sp.]|nr:hypothetical protein [Tidjanibacter sp.]